MTLIISFVIPWIIFIHISQSLKDSSIISHDAVCLGFIVDEDDIGKAFEHTIQTRPRDCAIRRTLSQGGYFLVQGVIGLYGFTGSTLVQIP